MYLHLIQPKNQFFINFIYFIEEILNKNNMNMLSDSDPENEKEILIGSDDNVSPQPTLKRKHYFTVFQNDWLNFPENKGWLEKHNEFSGKCKLCGICFVIKHDGVKAVRRHRDSINHRRIVSARNQSKLITEYTFKPNSHTHTKSTIAELAMVYHAVIHQHSYNSTDCGIKLNSKIYSDCTLSKQVHCGKTKASAYAENILAPKSIEMVLNDLTRNNQSLYFSLSTDATNRGNEKLFPIIVSYFNPEEGMKNKIIEFYEDEFESSTAIFEHITD